MPEEVELRFVRPPEFAHLSQQEWADKIRAAVAEQERRAAKERAETGSRVVGRKAVLRQSPRMAPESHNHRLGQRLRPRLATRNKSLRVALLRENKRFVHDYRDAYRRHRGGELGVEFPFGSYKLVEQGMVRCKACPALQ